MDSASASLIYSLLQDDTAAELARIKRTKVTHPDYDSTDHEAAVESWQSELERFRSQPLLFIAEIGRGNTVVEDHQVERETENDEDSSDDNDNPELEEIIPGLGALIPVEEESEVESITADDDEDSDDDRDAASETDSNHSLENENGASDFEPEEASVTGSQDKASIISCSPSLSSLSSTPSPPTDYEDMLPRERCLACLEYLYTEDLIQCPCDHYYCAGCMSDFVKATLSDTSIFPPKCCDKLIPFPTIKPSLSKVVVRKYEDRLKEMEAPPSICFNTECAKPIRAKNINDHIGFCTQCTRRTCTFCGKEAHFGDCKNKKEWDALQGMAKKKKMEGVPYLQSVCGSCERLQPYKVYPSLLSEKVCEFMLIGWASI
ncbi:E3 ubiquitin-protein ligase [Penicillium verhagenii]|nr:E3 ubiquitin-protein ligase [Penicillium verhagenii]